MLQPADLSPNCDRRLVRARQRPPSRRGPTAADFTILENGKPPPMIEFTAIDLPDADAPQPAWLRDTRPDIVRNKGQERTRDRVRLLAAADRSLGGTTACNIDPAGRVVEIPFSSHGDAWPGALFGRPSGGQPGRSAGRRAAIGPKFADGGNRT
jgi:hypothetical protein